jgi:uncharacterized protein YdhG (YjbR/CyaY superfamily)
MPGSDRKSHFPSIEKKHGMPMSYWFAQMEKVAGKKYPEQIAFLRENHGFSQAHANALVMFTRGSKSSRRFNTLEQYLEPFDAVKKKTVKAIFKAIKAKYPKMEIVIAWNQPMLKLGDDYIFGVTVLKNHILMAPWSKDVIAQFEDRLEDFKVNKKTIQVPVDWKINAKLLQDMAKARVKELKLPNTASVI